MKHIFYIICILLTLALWNTAGGKAQEIVLRGSTHSYSLMPVGTNVNYVYTWNVSGGTSSNFGTESKSNPITWDGPPGDYTISVYATDKRNGCAGNIQYIQVKVIDFPIRWQGTATAVCSAWGNEYRDFSVVAEFQESSSPWSFEYQIDNNPVVKVTITKGTSKVLNISGFINISHTTVDTHVIKIIRITISDGHQFTFDGTEANAAGHIHTVTVNPTPPPGKIEFVRDL